MSFEVILNVQSSILRSIDQNLILSVNIIPMNKIGTKIFDLVQQAVHREKIPLVQMKEISLRAKKLLKIYINHSVRTTSVTILGECGFEARHIISEHQNESSIRSK